MVLLGGIPSLAGENRLAKMRCRDDVTRYAVRMRGAYYRTRYVCGTGREANDTTI